MNGTWKVTGAGGLASAVPVVVVVASVAGVAWVLANLLVILAIVIVCGILTAVIVARLTSRMGRIETAGVEETRARMALEYEQRHRVASARQPAIGGDVHFHFHGVDDHQEAEQMVRRAIGQ